ncbi:hypothetical protein AVEN_200280-1 [Araneus ventricosus]|uniref:Uncharacterized protein n=1 Tax=Araneus ventricosus TaxID=182803 RepID=A0A4Y2P0F3_ARAVE|nr:hypothetical protein AVEN_200280-1 [Araneus ventricosus]
MATVQQKVRLIRLWFYESKSIVTVQSRFGYSIEIVILQVRTPSIVGMSNLREQEMCIIGKVLDDHRSQTKLFTEERDLHTLNSYTNA